MKYTKLDALVIAGLAFSAMGVAGFLHGYYAENNDHAIIGMILCFGSFIIVACIYELYRLYAREYDRQREIERKEAEKRESKKSAEEEYIDRLNDAFERMKKQQSAYDYIEEATRRWDK